MAKNADVEGVFDHVKRQEMEMIQGVDARFRNRLEYQYFPEDYFTGADTTVYFGDTFISDIMDLSFGLQEQVKPVNGYASYTWDAVPRSSRLVHGSFTIAFTEAGYMYTVLDHISLLKGNAKPRLAYLMGGEEVPNWIAGVKEDIEQLLNTHHGNPNAKLPDTETTTERKETYLDEFEWDTLQLKSTRMTDAKYPNKANRKRLGHLGQISQLQQRLIDLGFGWPDWKYVTGGKKGKPIDFEVRKRPSTTHSDRSFRLSPQVISKYNPAGAGHGNSWLLINRYALNSAGKQYTLGGQSYDRFNYWEVELQHRLDDYPGELDGLYMGGIHGTFDGRYGVRTAKGVNLFQQLAQIPAKDRAKNGNYLTVATYNELKKGLHVTGVFDTPTMIAVKLFQAKHGLTMDGIVGPATRKKLSPNATKTIKETHKKEGASLYAPNALYEPRVAKYEKEVWGRTSSADDNHRRRTFFYHGHANSAYLKEHGFDIYITYGPYPEKVIGNSGQMAETLVAKKTNFNTTVKAIRNVQLTGVQQILDVSGNPIAEKYMFMAQDLD